MSAPTLSGAAVGVLPPPRVVGWLRTTPGHIRACFGTHTVDDERAGATLVDTISAKLSFLYKDVKLSFALSHFYPRLTHTGG